MVPFFGVPPFEAEDEFPVQKKEFSSQFRVSFPGSKSQRINEWSMSIPCIPTNSSQNKQTFTPGFQVDYYS